MAEKIQQPESILKTLETLNDQLGRIMPYRLAMVSPGDLVLASKNARFMKPETFRNLSENIRKDGNLTSVPFCCRDQNGALHVLSGNHRIQAAIDAGVAQVLVMFTDEADDSRKTAIQLSHNALEGDDDLQTLKELWDSIENLDLKIYAGLDSDILQKFEKIEFETIREARLDYKSVSLLFLPEEAEKAAEVFERISALFGKEEVYLVSLEKWEQFFTLISTVKTRAKIKNSATAFACLLDMAEAKINELLPSTET